MGPGESILSYGLPFVLLAGALSRISVPSFFYLVAFAVTTIWSPHPLLKNRKAVVTITLWILSIYSGLMCLGHIIFQSVLGAQTDYGRKLLPETGTVTTVLQYVGFQRIPDVGEGFRLITADVVVFAAATTFLVLLKRNIIFSREYESYAKNQFLAYIPRGPSTLNGLAVLGLLLLNGLAFASGLQSIYFIVFQAVLVAKAFLRIELSRIIDIIYLPIFIYDIIHILGVYVIQADPIRERIPVKWSLGLGFKFYDVDITPDPLMGVTICLSWASSIFLLILLAFRKRNYDLRALTGMDRSYLTADSEGSESGRLAMRAEATKDTRFWRIAKRLVRDWGWRICVVALLAIPLFLPSFFSVFLLFAVCIAAVVPQVYLERYYFIPGVTIYLILITSMQYIYNIPNIGIACPDSNMTPLCAVGFRIYPYTWFQIGLQTLACILLAVNWGYRTVPGAGSLSVSSSSKRRHKKAGENLLHDGDGDDAEALLLENEETESQHRAPRSRRHSQHRHRRHSHHQHQHQQEPEDDHIGARRRGHARDTSFMGFLSYNDDEVEDEVKSISSEPKEKPGCCGRCTTRVGAWWRDVRPALKAMGFWALKQSYLLCLCGVYVAGLHQVNILNSVYLLILILFLTSPRIARQFWLALVLYCEAVILVVYTWSATPWTANIHSPKILPMIGLQTYTSTTLLFTQGLVWHLVILLFAVIQLWVLRYTATLVGKGQDRPTEKIPRWMRAIGDTFFWAWDEYGLVPVYTILVGVASADGDISFINIMYITLVFVCLTIHMLTRKADIHIKRFWIFIVVASGVILLARYAYQFSFIQEFLANVLPADAITAIGFVDFKATAVFAPLLGNTFVFLVAVIQLQTFFAKKDLQVGPGHNAYAQRLVTASDFESGFVSDQVHTDYSDYESSSSRPSSLPGSFKFQTEDYDSEHVPLGTADPQASTSHPIYSADEARVLSEREQSARAERTVSASQRLIMDEELMAEDLAKHPASTLRQRKRRLRRKHVFETIIWTWALDIIYWLKRFCMLHAYKITAIVMMAIAVKSPSGLNSVYVEIALLSVSADHLTDGVGLLLLLYTQLSILFVLIYQFEAVHDGLSAYQPLVSWAGFDWLPKNRFSLISMKMVIVVAILVQRFAHRWKNDWYRVKKIEIEHELEPPSPVNVDLFYSELASKHAPSNYPPQNPSSVYLRSPSEASSSSKKDASHQNLEFNLSATAQDNSKYGILQQLQYLTKEDERDNEAIEDLKLKYLKKTELTLFLYDSSDFLVMSDHFNLYEAWNVFAWFCSNLLTICGYPALVAALLLVILVHKETVYGVIFLLLLGLTIITRRARWTSSGWPIKILTVYVAVELLLQYILNLDLPPPDLRYPWYNWNPEWLAWLGLKQSSVHSGMLVADFVLLLVVARIRRISEEELKQATYSRYWHYLVGPVITIRESKTWRDSVRYSVYRFSPFVILLLIFVAGTIHPDALSLIYVFFALLFIFRESTIYSQRNKIWRFARLYNFALILIILLYQIPVINLNTSAMSAARVIGLRKFSEEGGSILFSLFIFVLLGIQKRLFSRVEFDELVLSILDEEEKGVRMAQERFQEWKMERRREFQHVQEEKRKRRRQLDFLKAARTRQQKIWQRLAKGAAEGGRASMLIPSADGTIQAGEVAQRGVPSEVTTAAAHAPPGVVPHASQFAGPAAAGSGGFLAPYPAHLPPSYGDYINDPRMRTLSTTRDLKMLESAGDLTIEEDPTSRALKMKFKSRPTSTVMPQAMVPPRQVPVAATSTLPIVADDEVIVPSRPDDEEDEEDEPSQAEALPNVGSDDEEEEDLLASMLQQPRASIVQEDDEVLMPKCCQCWKTPQFVLTAAEVIISWLDRHTDGYLAQKPHYSRKKKIWAGFYKIYQINSSVLCYLFFMINCAVNSDIISLVYPLSMFLYALLETPRPHKLYWNTIFVYAALAIIVKFFYQFSLFCTCNAPLVHWALASECQANPTCLAPLDTKKSAAGGLASSFHWTAPRVTGITSYSAKQGGRGISFIYAIIPDLLVLISIFLHRYWLKKLGYWNFVQRLTLSKEGSDEPMSQRQLHDEARRFEQILLKQQKKREQWTRYAAEKKKRRFAKKAALSSGDSGPSPSYLEESMDPDLETGPSATLTNGVKIVTNPLFKMGESDFETDAEEMSTPKSPSLLASRHVRFDGPGSASALKAQGEMPAQGASSSHASMSSEPATTSTVGISSILGATVGSQATKRRVEGARSTMESDMDETITIGQRGSESSDSEEDGEEGDGSSVSSSSSSSYESDEYDEEEENLYNADRSNARGVRRKRALNNAKRWFRSRWYDIANFFQNLVAHKPGRDWYVHMWFVELLCFFFIIVLPSPFIGNAAGNVADFLTQSRLPNSYVLTLLVQFLFIVMERVLYLFRAIKIKVIYHCVLVVFYHIWLLFISPVFTGADFRSQKVLITFYLLKLIYLYLSSLQIMHGYPAFIQGQFLTDSNEPGIFRWLIYIAYRAIPFVYELRTLLDWTVTKTSLTFFEWLKLEDIYANLFLVKCRVSQDKVWQRNVGDPQAWYVKWGMGVLLFIGLSALIWFPLLLLMQGSPGNQSNSILAASISIGFTGYATPIYTGVAVSANMKGKNNLSQDMFNKLRLQEPAITYDDYSIIQWIEFENFSDASWIISPPAKHHLISDLETHPTTLSVHITFTRTVAINSGIIANFDKAVDIPVAIIPEVIKAINGSHGNFSIPHLIPRYFRVPNSGDAARLSGDATTDPIAASFDINNQGELYWNCFGVPISGELPWDNSNRIQLVTFSAEAPRGILRGLASVGLIGLYVGVVLAVARFLRLSVTDLAFRIIYEDMPACEELISYCEDIYLARQDGDLVLEEELFRELVEIYRSPETIIGRTVRTHPRFAGRELTEKELRRLAKEDPAAAESGNPKID
jgi:hypothetical protein